MTEQYYNAPNSICPKGWRLPYNINDTTDPGDAGEQEIWVSSYGDIVDELSYNTGNRFYTYQSGGFNAIRVSPLWLVRSGYIAGGSLYFLDSGYYWSSTVYGKMYGMDISLMLRFRNNVVATADFGDRYQGSSVRCVAR